MTEWNVTTPAEAGFAPDLARRFDIARDAGILPNLHAVLAARSGRIFFERYFAGTDSARGRPLGVVSASFQRAVSMPDGRSYGYHWYVGAVPRDDGTGGIRWEKAISAIGNGGQRLFLLPQLDLIVTITAGNYDSPDHWRPPMIVLRDIILPSLH